MKTTPRRSSSPVWLLLVLALGVSAVASSMNPSHAVARTRPVNSEPLAGDPTDTNDGPAPSKSSGSLRSSALPRYATKAGVTAQLSTPQLRLASRAAFLGPFYLAFQSYWRFTR